MSVKYEVHFIYENKPYAVSLHDTERSEGDEKIRVAGRNYGINKDSKLPDCAYKLFESLRENSFKDEKKLLKHLEASSEVIGANCVSITKQTYDLATDALLKKQSYDSEGATALRETTYKALNSCNSADKEQITKIIQNSNCPDVVLFEIADQIQKDGKIELAHLIRETARPFDLKSSLDSIGEKITLKYFDKLKGAEFMEVIASKFNNGDYEDIYEADEFAFRLTNDLRETSHDFHFEVETKRNEPTMESAKETNKKELNRLESNNFGFGEIKELEEERACLLEIHKMENPKATFDGREITKEKAIELINKIKDSSPEAIIFDLRRNSGGSTSMSELFCSYFHEADVLLSHYEYREQPKETNIFPTEPKQTWSYERLPKEERILKTPIYILTSRDTMSAGEDFVCHFKELNRDNNRVTVIGETTRGAANVTELCDAGKNFNVAVPIGEPIIPYDNYNRNWEGVGITPHVEAEAEKALEIAKSLIKKSKEF
jgi:hypothetical protein